MLQVTGFLSGVCVPTVGIMSITRLRAVRRAPTVLFVALLAALVPVQAGAVATGRSQLQRDADALRDAGVVGVSVRIESPDGVRARRSG